MSRIGFRTLCLALVLGATGFCQTIQWPPMNFQPPVRVPEVYDSSSPYSCQTIPAGNGALIRCRPADLGRFPAAMLVFLRAHEYGHINQLRFNPALAYSPYAEYDADCYAASVLVNSDPVVLAAAIQYMWNVIGPNMGDATHGNGFQVAQRALECARAVQPSYMSQTFPRFPVEKEQALAWSLGGERPHTLTRKPPRKTQQMDLDSLADERGQPSRCTAVDVLVDGAHSNFWEASTKTGAVRPALSKAMGAECGVERGNQVSLSCRATSEPLEQWVASLEACFDSAEWTKSCTDDSCRWVHPGDADDHTTVSISRKTHVFTVSAGTDKHVKQANRE